LFLDFNAPASQLLEGRDPTPGFVAAELAGSSQIALFQRTEDGDLIEMRRRFEPWLLAADPNPWSRWRGADVDMLSGGNAYHTIVRFPDWRSFRDANQHARDTGLNVVALASPIEQFLVASGITQFKGMRFEQLRRLQLDIETIGLDPKPESGRILMVALSWENDQSRIIELHTTEADLLDELTDAIVKIDPDVIEGHNVFNFDLPFIEERARRWSRPLNWGRDGSALRITTRDERMTVGPLSHSFCGASI
jgi:DNA polymerase, archaea type